MKIQKVWSEINDSVKKPTSPAFFVIRSPDSPSKAHVAFEFYNKERFHQALDYKTPCQVYLGRHESITIMEKVCLKSNVSVFEGSKN